MDDLRDLFDRRDEYQFVDVREPYEWAAGRIEGAIHLPLAALMAGGEDDRLDRDRPIIAVCRSGNRSELATMMLRARGYEAFNMEGGMEAWSAAGLPFTAEDGAPGRVA